MGGLFDRLLGRKTPSSARAAKDRLRMVLVTDRTSLSPEDLRNMQQEILEVIKKYCRVDDAGVELKLEQRERDNYLVADIPITGKTEGHVRVETSLISAEEDMQDSTREATKEFKKPDAPDKDEDEDENEDEVEDKSAKIPSETEDLAIRVPSPSGLKADDLQDEKPATKTPIQDSTEFDTQPVSPSEMPDSSTRSNSDDTPS